MERTIRCQGAVLRHDHILLVEHRNHRTGHVYWWLPGGARENGETTEGCAIREIREETGLEVRIEWLLLSSGWGGTRSGTRTAGKRPSVRRTSCRCSRPSESS